MVREEAKKKGARSRAGLAPVTSRGRSQPENEDRPLLLPPARPSLKSTGKTGNYSLHLLDPPSLCLLLCLARPRRLRLVFKPYPSASTAQLEPSLPRRTSSSPVRRPCSSQKT